MPAGGQCPPGYAPVPGPSGTRCLNTITGEEYIPPAPTPTQTTSEQTPTASITTEAPPLQNFEAQDPSFTIQQENFQIPTAQEFEQQQGFIPVPVVNQTSRTATQEQAPPPPPPPDPVTEPQIPVEPVERVPTVLPDKSNDLVTLAAVGTVAALTIAATVLWK